MKPILFITGAFISHSYWAQWCVFFEERGFQPFAPAWPGLDLAPQKLRQDGRNSKTADLTWPALMQYYRGYLEKFEEPPILVGHSVGGLIAQKLLQEGLAEGGIILHGFPPGGVSGNNFCMLPTLVRLCKVFIRRRKSFMPSKYLWGRMFLDTAQKDARVYDDFAIPASKRVVATSLRRSADAGSKGVTVPILFISGSKDVFVPASSIYANYLHCKSQNNMVSYKEFEEHHHLIVDPAEKEEVMEYMLQWIKNLN